MSPEFAASLDDRYTIVRELGQGGMATVYLARDVRHDRDVAIKVLHPDLGAALGAERFLAEIKTTAKLQHPHILTLLDSGSADGLLYYVMPVVSGESLRDRLSRERQLPLPEALRISREVASALDYAHRHDVIHRDIKPENILLHDGSAIVADFGIALAVQSASGPRMTQTGLSLGTPQYMSPEQAMGERNIDARSDIYALGAVTYEMLTGDPPFTGSSVQAIVAKVMTERPTAPHVMRDTVPPYVEAAVMTALAKLPADRFATAAEFSAALDGRGASASAHAPIAAPAPRNHTLVIASIAAAVALIAGAGAMRFFGASPSQGARYFQKTFDERSITNERFAPDGKTLVYSVLGEQGPEIMLVRPDYPEPQRIGLAQTQLLAVSKTGELAVLTRPVYYAFSTYVGTLARAPMAGGAARELVDSVSGADWSPDGSQLAIVRFRGGKQQLEYPIGTVLYSTPGWITDVRVAPDGKTIAFADHPLNSDDRGTIDLVDLAGHRTILTPEEFGGTEGMAWSPDGKTVFFSSRTTTHQKVVFAVTRSGKQREALNGAGDLRIMDINAEGRWLVDREVDIRKVALHQLSDSTARLTGWLDYGWKVVLTGDGTRLAFSDASTESGTNYSVLLRSDSGDRTVRIGEGWPEQFTRDKKWVLSIVPTTPARLALYPTGAGSERVIPTPSMQTLDRAALSPDEQAVLVCGNGSDKKHQCLMQTLDGKTVRSLPADVVPSGAAEQSPLSPDGSAVFGERDNVPVIASITDGSVRPIPNGARIGRVLRWSPDGRGLWVIPKGSSDIALHDAVTGAETVLVPHAIDAFSKLGVWTRLVLADNPRIAAAVISRQSSELFLVEGAK